MLYLRSQVRQHHTLQQQKFRSLFLGYLDAQDKQAMQYQLTPRFKMEDAPTLLKISKSECPDPWIRLPRHNWPKTWQSVEHWVFLEGNRTDTPRCRTAVGETVRRMFCSTMDGRKHKPGNASVCIASQGQFLSVYVDDIKIDWEEAMWK